MTILQTDQARRMSAVGADMSRIAEDTSFRTLAESLPQLVWTTLPDGQHDYFNRRWYEFTGLAPEESLGQGWRAAIHPDDRDLTEKRWREALAGGAPFEIEYRICGADGRHRWFLGRALPIRDAGGGILKWFGTCTEIEAQKKAEEALRRLDDQHRLALEAADLGTWDYNVASGIVSFDRRACNLFDLEAEGIRSLPIEKSFGRIDAEDRERVRAALVAAIAPGSDGRFEAEYRLDLPEGGARWLHIRGQSFFTGEGPRQAAIRVSGVVSDVTQRRNSEETQRLVARELNHRVKNLFAITTGMVSATARTAKTPKDMANALRGRLGALARAHELVRPAFAATNQGGKGTTVEHLVHAILAAHAEPERRRLTIEGPAVAVGPSTTTSLALVLHELATNAAKYGSLSTADGVLSIHWALAEDGVRLTWTESGGPRIGEAPTFEGFGSLLARKTIAGQLGGSLAHDWRADGLRVRMILPLDRLSL